MAMKVKAASGFVTFDVLYENGSRSSNRKVPANLLGGLDGDEPAREMIEAQDREIAAASGRARSDIKSVFRSPVKPANEDSAMERKSKGGKR